MVMHHQVGIKSRAPRNGPILVSFLTLSLLLPTFIVYKSEAVNLNRYDKLAREELLKLDWEVTEYYQDSYEVLDRRNVTYDDHLFKSIRALRHTIVLNQFDYRYTDATIMRNSAGPKVDPKLCDKQLGTLVRMAESREKPGSEVPLSAINFLESSGRTEPGILNGNFIWWGSFSSCTRASISAQSARKFMGRVVDDSSIKGRYCVAHLRAKSWPKYDIYFEDRITIRVGICIPESCHSSQYFESRSMQDNIDRLTRMNLASPFNSERYEISYLYCLPDEDSPFRQWDLGTQLFVAFSVVWVLLLIWCNYKYHQRSMAMRKLRNTVDIRMIIKQKKESTISSSSTEDEDSSPDEQISSPEVQKSSEVRSLKEPPKSTDTQSLRLPDSASRCSSNNPTPMASDIEENDGEFNAIRPIVVDSNKCKKSSRNYADQGVSTPPSGIDLIQAFSIESNINYLLKTRRGEARARGDRNTQQLSSDRVGKPGQPKRASQQQITTSINRRTSSSNEALIKNLKQHEQELGNIAKPKVAILDESVSNSGRDEQRFKHRVNVDIFDGIKVFATSWIIYGHTLMLFFGLVMDLRFGDERMLDFIMVASINTLQVVGLFYIITGALLTYLAFSRQKTEQLLKPSFWILVVFSRYIRLIPTYLLVFWFARHVSPFTGSGIFWFDYRTDSEHVRGYCSTESWATMLTMSAADIKIPLDCIPQAWYLSNDFRTLLILPFFIIILALNRTAGYGAIASTFVYSAFKMFNILRAANIDYRVVIRWKPHVYSILADRLHDVYTNLSVRLSTYLLGVVIGHLLYLYETRQIPDLPKGLRKYGMKIALLVASVFFMGGPLIARFYYLFPSPDEIDSDLVVILIPVFKGAMELSMCVILLLLASGGGYKWISTFLTGKYAKILSNISYGVFLVHVEVMYKIPSFKFESSYWYLFVYSTFFVVCSIVAAFLIHVLYEMPVNNVLRYLIRRVYKSVLK